MKQITDFKLIEKQDYGNVSWLKLHSESDLPAILPGQFVEVRVDGSPKTYLRRPISIHDVDAENRCIELLVAKVGEGSTTLTMLPIGATVNLVLPLGNGFTYPEKGEEVLLVGGGVGIAPMLYFAKMLKMKGFEPALLLGGKTEKNLMRLDEYRRWGATFVTTEDGSMGEKGFVTQHSIWSDKTFDKVYVCGPKPMMKAVFAVTKENGIWCEVSLENMMACGLGACLCCVEKTVEGNTCVCKEGPVFNTRRLLW